MSGIQSLVENGTLAIDRTMFVWTHDKVQIDGHFYSDKPPLSYIIGAPIYFIISRLGITFASNAGLAYKLITLFTIGLSLCLLLVYFFRFLKRYDLSDEQRFLYTFALGLGTQLWPYSLVFNNHALGAALLFLGFYACLQARTPRQLFWTGVLTGFAAAIDLVAGNIFLVLFGIMLYRKHGFKNVRWYILGGCILPILALIINYALSGSFTYFNLNEALWNFPGNAYDPVLPSNDPVGYGKALLIGWQHGFFFLNLLLIFAVLGIGVILALVKKYRTEALIIATGVVCTFLYYALRTRNFGGCGWGFRYMVPLIPLMFAYVPVPFQVKGRWQPVLRYLFIIALIVSVFVTIAGTKAAWGCDARNSINAALQLIK